MVRSIHCLNDRETHMSARLAQLRDFYALLDRLGDVTGRATLLRDCTGRLAWPQRGVYFFTELGENRSGTGTGPRVVRVGTHALNQGSRSTLWGRLAQHRGTLRSGRGNHRGSIFRLLIGTALISRSGSVHSSWGIGGSAEALVRTAERELEVEVSDAIGAMSVMCLPIDDEPGPSSMRGYIERNAIALLSNFGRESIDPPSSTWLGRLCSRDRVRQSGLWNQNHVDETPNPDFIPRLRAVVEALERAP